MTLLDRLYEKSDQLLDTTILLNVSKAGYYLRQSGWDPQETWVSMRDKVCIVTGANSGLGKVVSTHLAALGARVYLLCRDETRGRQAWQDIIQRTRNEEVFLELADVSSQTGVRGFVERFAARENRLDILINNAGAFLPERQFSEEGLEMTFATNTLGPFLLTNLLIPLLGKTASSRVINVSSASMYFAKLNVDDLQFQRRPYLGALAYAESKRAEVVLTQIWARRLEHAGIGVHAMHPGWADTPAVRSAFPTAFTPLRALLRTPEQGVDTLLWLAVNTKITAEDSGQFWFDRRPRPTERFGIGRNTEEERHRFWETCCQLTRFTPETLPEAA